MVFKYSDYYDGFVGRPMFFIYLGVAILGISAVIYIFHPFIQKIVRKEFNKNRVLFNIIPIVIVLSIGFTSLDYDFLSDNQSEVKYTTGTIGDISVVADSPRFYYQDSYAHAQYISIEGVEYYIMTIGEFEVGDEIELWYLPKSKVILEIQYQDTN